MNAETVARWGAWTGRYVVNIAAFVIVRHFFGYEDAVMIALCIIMTDAGKDSP